MDLIIILWIFLAAAAIRYKSVPAAIFVSCAVVHDILCGSIDGSKYYVTSGAFEGVAVVLLGLVGGETAKQLRMLAVLALFMDFVGLLMYRSDSVLSMLPYNFAFVVIYATAIVITGGGATNVGRHPKLRPDLRYRRNSVPEGKSQC